MPRASCRAARPTEVTDVVCHSLTKDFELMHQVNDVGIKVTSEWGSRPLGFVQSVHVDYVRDLDLVGTVEAVADARLDSAGAEAY